MPNHHATT